MTPEEVRALISQGEGQRLELKRSLAELEIDDLDLDLLDRFRVAYQEKRRRRLIMPNMGLLESLGAVVERNSDYHPTVAGILVFGKAAQRFVPQSRMVIVRYPGDRVTLRGGDKVTGRQGDPWVFDMGAG